MALLLSFVGMSNFDENVFQCGALLREFAHIPRSIGGKAKNFFAHVRARLHTKRKDFPIAVVFGSDIADSADFLELGNAVVGSNFRFDSHPARSPNSSKQIFR